MSKETAVEWFVKELFKKIDYIQVDPKLIEQAIAMEKEQIVDACNSQRNDYRGMPTYNKSGEQYYNEKYGGNK